MSEFGRLHYYDVGDNYDTKDPIKILAQRVAFQTGRNLLKHGFQEIEDSRGESAYVWREGSTLRASVIEGLGTENLVADQMRQITGKTYYDVIGYSTVATIVNDLATAGAKPLVIHSYWAIEDNGWLQDTERMSDLYQGWEKACDDSEAAWGGGETATLKGIIQPGTAEFAGMATGIIGPEARYLRDERLEEGDRILLLKSSGVNDNGLSLVRTIASRLPKGYATQLSDGRMFGEAVLNFTNIYATLIQDLLNEGIRLHYVSNITGHGLRKVMRGRPNFTYVLERLVDTPEIFEVIKHYAGLDDKDMFETYNMGMDYALYLPKGDVAKAQDIIRDNDFESIDAGYVERGEKRVIIEAKGGIELKTLELR